MARTRATREQRKTRLIEHDLGDGWRVLVGRSDADNEELSLRIARPQDWWFHVRGMPGSHVLLQALSGGEPSRALLEQAAAIAAYHSKARAGGVVPVSCARGRDVSKPPGSKLGTVQIRKETVMKVRPAAAPASEGGQKSPA